MIKVMLYAGAVSLTALTGAAAPTAANCQTNPNLTCHEQCAIDCARLYPDDPAMNQLCRWSCIDQKCGGGPFPFQ